MLSGTLIGLGVLAAHVVLLGTVFYIFRALRAADK
jgi:hypothetical protein